uniref:Myosin light chain 9 n=1 Tax=Equus caballus TaxID=9796 RepID=A0A9L0RJA9_HORSE
MSTLELCRQEGGGDSDDDHHSLCGLLLGCLQWVPESKLPKSTGLMEGWAPGSTKPQERMALPADAPSHSCPGPRREGLLWTHPEPCEKHRGPGNSHLPEAKMSSKRAKAKTTKKRPQRATSNVFAMFDQSQIQEFKEAFNMIDQNRDGFIDKEDLHDMLASMGKNPTDEYLEGMMSEAPGPINFTMFLTMFGEKLNGTDPEDVIRNAFACFDEEASGFIHEDHLRELLTTMGDRFTDEEVDEMYREAPIDKKGNFNYVEFTRILKHGAKDKDD